MPDNAAQKQPKDVANLSSGGRNYNGLFSPNNQRGLWVIKRKYNQQQ